MGHKLCLRKLRRQKSAKDIDHQKIFNFILKPSFHYNAINLWYHNRMIRSDSVEPILKITKK